MLLPIDTPGAKCDSVTPLVPAVVDIDVTPLVSPAVRGFQIPGNVKNSEPDAMFMLCGMLAKVRVKLIMPPPTGECPVSPTK